MKVEFLTDKEYNHLINLIREIIRTRLSHGLIPPTVKISGYMIGEDDTITIKGYIDDYAEKKGFTAKINIKIEVD